MIEVDGVEFSYTDEPVLTSVSLSVSSGEIVGLIGPNGAGKTTLMRVISAALTPDRGRVTVNGERVHDLPSKAASRHVSVVPQETRLSFDFPVRDVVMMGRNPYKSRFDRTNADDTSAVERAMAETDVDDFADRAFSTLSGGEKKRVLVARAVAQETPAMLLDEPTASLDINHQISIIELSRALADDGKAILAAIHDLNLAARYCDRLVLLTDGQIAAADRPSAVLEPARLEEAYGIETEVVEHPLTGVPTVVPHPSSPTPTQ